MSDPIVVDDAVTIPARAIRMSASRSGGPGGQNVNKVSSKVDLRVDLSQIVGLSPFARARLEALAGKNLDADGQLQVVCQVHRERLRNLAEAREKVRAMVAAALVVPVRRRKTRPSRGKVEARLADKRETSERKQRRAVSRGGGRED